MIILGPDRQPAVRSVGRRFSRTLEIVAYTFEHKGFRYKLVVPMHYLFDGASIPRLCWTLIGLAPHGPMDGPALPHDFIYQHQGRMPEGSLYIYDLINRRWVECSVPISKNTADLLLRGLCMHLGATNRVQAEAVYSAVAAFGWWAWMRDDMKRKNKEITDEEIGVDVAAGGVSDGLLHAGFAVHSPTGDGDGRGDEAGTGGEARLG